MSRNKKIAVSYLFAVPISLAIVFYQYTLLKKVANSRSEVSAAAAVIQETDDVLALLNGAETNAQKYVESNGNSADIAAYRDSISKVQNALQRIGDQTKGEQSVQASYQKMGKLVSKQISLLNQAITARNKGRGASPGQGGGIVLDRDIMGDIVTVRAEINAVQRVRLDHQTEASRQNEHQAILATTFGGGVLIWLVGVAAFLLFHQEKTRVWAGVERRVHTKILQILPVGVSVATDTGVILYTNGAEDTLLDYKSGELMGKDATLLHDLEGPSGKPIVDAILERLEAGQAWAGELPLRRKDGTIHNIPSWVMNLEFPGKVYRLFVHRSQ